MVYVCRFPPIIAVLCSKLANYGALPGSAVSRDSIYRVNRLPIIRWYQIFSNENHIRHSNYGAKQNWPVDYGQRFVQALEMHTFCWSSQSLWLLWALTQSRMLPNSIRKKTQHHQMPMGINGSKSHIWYNVGPPSYKLVYNLLRRC